MLTQSEIGLIKATVPILKEHGVALTSHFYNRMFTHNAELKNLFNMGNQQSGKQQTALAMSVLAYAENIENPGVLLPVLKMIGEKHTSLQISAEQYDIVGGHLLASIREVLGEGATDELVNAWAKAYGQLADIMINLEQSIYMTKASLPGSWAGWRKFVVKQKVEESTEITSFHLYPEDGGQVVAHQPGQYLSVKVFVPELGIFQPRQYSISSAPNSTYYRISVKKEAGAADKNPGIISNQLHEFINEGDVIEVTQPSGEFVLHSGKNNPIVLFSGGVGLTPFVSFVNHLAANNSVRPVKWIHACRSEEVHAFKNEMKELVSQNDWLEHIVFYEQHDTQETGVMPGRINVESISSTILPEGAEYYLCGPQAFIGTIHKGLMNLGVEQNKVFFEEFGPQTIQLN